MGVDYKSCHICGECYNRCSSYWHFCNDGTNENTDGHWICHECFEEYNLTEIEVSPEDKEFIGNRYIPENICPVHIREKQEKEDKKLLAKLKNIVYNCEHCKNKLN